MKTIEKPRDIPELIWDAAYEEADAFSDWFGCDGEKRMQLTEAFARASMKPVSWEARADLAERFILNYADGNKEKLLGGYDIQPMIRHLAGMLFEMQIPALGEDKLGELEQLPAKLLRGEHSCFHLTFNDEHAINYMTAADYFEGHPDWDHGWISAEEREKAVANNSVWTLQWYPDTPVGFLLMRASTAAAVVAHALKEADGA